MCRIFCASEIGFSMHRRLQRYILTALKYNYFQPLGFSLKHAPGQVFKLIAETGVSLQRITAK